jgi:transcriptional regulator with XRE-family HTH domain
MSGDCGSATTPSEGGAHRDIRGYTPTDMAATSTRREAPPIGHLLKHWRQVRHKSQLTLALDAEISPRHLGFIEIGRARPSREMILTLAQALEVPLRERNELLLAAGFAPIYHETSLADPALTPAREALDAILRQQEPFPAVVMDRYWNVLLANDAAARLFGAFVDLDAEPQPLNVLRLIFDPTKVKPYVVDWDDVAEALIRRVHRETVAGVVDPRTKELLEELLRYPDAPRRTTLPDLAAESPPFTPVAFRVGEDTLRYFSTVTTLGTPRDITLQEIRIESFFPADAETAARARAMAGE